MPTSWGGQHYTIPGPAKSALSGPAFNFALQVAAELANTMLSGITVSSTRNATYTGNRIGATMIPPIDKLMYLWWTGRISVESMKDGMNSQGILWDPGGTDTRRWPSAWWSIMNLSQPKWEVGDYRRWKRQGRIDDDKFKAMMSRHGFTTDGLGCDNDCTNAANYDLFADEFETWDFTSTIELWRRGVITWDDLLYYLSILGISRQRELDAVGKMYTVPTVFESMVLRNREWIDDDKFDLWVKRAGFADDEVREQMKNLRFEIPGPSDLVRFSIREVWQQPVVQRFGYDAEFPPEFAYWMNKQGLNWSEPITLPDGTVLPAVEWPLAYWRAHWDLPSPTQAYSFLQRARGDPLEPASWRIPGLAPFTSTDLSLLLRTKDYPPYFRPYLEAISYRVPDVRSIRWARQFHIIDQNEGVERYQDQGYKRQDAILLTDIDTARNDARENKWLTDLQKKTFAQLIKCTLDMYAIGGISRSDTVALLVGSDVPQEDAESRLSAIDACWFQGQLKRAIQEIRKAYLRGIIDQLTAQQRLGLAGVVAEFIPLYLQRWQVEFTPSRKRLSTAQALNALERGFITTPEAVLRLQNIGWDQPDILILLADAARIMAERQAKAQAAQVATQKQQAAELARLVREAEAQRRKLLTELNRVQPIDMLKRLAKKGEITMDEFIQALNDRLIPYAAQNLFLKDVYGPDVQQPSPA